MVVQENHKELLLASVPESFHPRLEKAIALAEKHYAGITRWSGESLLDHVLRSARYYAELRIDFNGVVAAVLHHKLPDEVYQDSEVFDDDVRKLLKNVERVFRQAKEGQRETQIIYKYILSFEDDIRIALLKLSEKYDNARTIDLLPEDKKLRVARRLLEIYGPLAEFMNLTNSKREFELHGFRVLHPDAYSEVVNWVHQSQKDINEKIDQVKELLEEIAKLVNVEGQVWGRVKSYYSIWKKQQKHSKEGKVASLDRFHDLIAFTIMVDSVDQCYAVAYALKDYAKVPDADFEDYIRNPKPNGFSEIQLVCSFPELLDITVEIQVLTNEMYWHNTYGAASHIAYKLSGRRYAKKNTEFQWVETVHREIEQSKEYGELLESRPIHMKLFNDRVYVFTPLHRVIELPKGSTAIDFAYYVHTNIGHHASFARINGKTTILSTKLNNGDVVEVITDPKKKLPSESWLAFAKTKSAQAKIRAALRKKLQAEVA